MALVKSQENIVTKVVTRHPSTLENGSWLVCVLSDKSLQVDFEDPWEKSIRAEANNMLPYVRIFVLERQRVARIKTKIIAIGSLSDDSSMRLCAFFLRQVYFMPLAKISIQGNYITRSVRRESTKADNPEFFQGSLYSIRMQFDEIK
jgi:hypothetical protein